MHYYIKILGLNEYFKTKYVSKSINKGTQKRKMIHILKFKIPQSNPQLIQGNVSEMRSKRILRICDFSLQENDYCICKITNIFYAQ